MKNPCRTCLINTMCSVVCDPKVNFMTYVEEAIRNYNFGRSIQNKQHQKLFNTYRKYQKENSDDVKIIVRRLHKSQGY